MATRLNQPGRNRPLPIDRRDGDRHPVTLTGATSRSHAAEPVDAVLEDVSSFGCRLTCGDDQPAGSRVWLRLSGSMPVAATVVWSREGQIGCRFDQPIDPRLMRTLIRPVN